MTPSTVVLITLLCVLIAMNISEFIHLVQFEKKYGADKPQQKNMRKEDERE